MVFQVCNVEQGLVYNILNIEFLKFVLCYQKNNLLMVQGKAE